MNGGLEDLSCSVADRIAHNFQDKKFMLPSFLNKYRRPEKNKLQKKDVPKRADDKEQIIFDLMKGELLSFTAIRAQYTCPYFLRACALF